MNNYINYYYNIYPDLIHEQNKTFYFEYDNEKYYFVMFNRPIEDAPYLYELNQEMIAIGSLVHEIVLNKDQNVLTFVNNIPYVLMKVYVNVNKKSDLSEIIFISVNNSNVKMNRILDRSDWVSLWCNKIDYFEYQINQIGKKCPLICDYFGYYIGLAENAIAYVGNTFKESPRSEYDIFGVAHKRIRHDDTAFDIYNPISFIMDYLVRDFAEYIKTKFFNGEDVWDEIEEYFKYYDLTVFSKRLLYARLLFPSYFFDTYEDVIEDKIPEDNILPIIYKAEEYEKFLIEFHSFVSKNNPIPQLDWLKQKKSY